MADYAPRYAHAFAGAAAAGNLDATIAYQQLMDFEGSLAGSHELHEFLTNPSESHEQKMKVIDAIAARMQLLPQVRNFIAVIVQHERLDGFKEIVEAYHEIADDQSGVAEAEITSAHPIAEQDRTALLGQIARMAGMRVKATYREDASLLGGAVVRIGSTVYDGSIRAQLEQLKERMLSAQ